MSHYPTLGFCISMQANTIKPLNLGKESFALKGVMRATKLLLALVLCGTLGATYDGNVEFEEEFDGEYEEDVGPMFASVDHDDDEGNSSTTEMPTEASSPPFILVSCSAFK